MDTDEAIGWLHSNTRIEYSGCRQAAVALTNRIEDLERQNKDLERKVADLERQNKELALQNDEYAIAAYRAERRQGY